MKFKMAITNKKVYYRNKNVDLKVFSNYNIFNNISFIEIVELLKYSGAYFFNTFKI